MKKTVLKEYAKLIVNVGANVQKGQEVQITAEMDQPEFVAYVAEAAYKAGAKKVTVDWKNDALTKLNAKYQKLSTLSKVEAWEEAKLQHMVDTLPCRIYIMSEDPDGLKGISQPKYSKALAARGKITKPYRQAINNKHQWTIAAVPGEKWAKKVFPHLSKKQAVEALWEAILSCARTEGDAVANWQAHNAEMEAHADFLNAKKIRKLHYTASNGTDLTVGLMERSRFCAACDTTLSGVKYTPNMPTEEVFTTPKKGEAEGIVYASMPLSYQGQLIENFSMEFKNGKVVSVKAEKNEALLQRMVEMDENAGYLGECALVPKESPINRSGLIFYNTLFDENASCHLALGMGYDTCVEGFADLTREELAEMGVNDSVIHVDFMIGTEDMSIDGITEDGEIVPIFRNGTWAV
ncbi:MAG: aminopeptidase [Oscillospiraceae bacterium]|nr:aminopeptidase [Oscillospiraceae bacterium]